MIAYKIDDSDFRHTIIRIIDNNCAIATQISINKRLNNTKKFGVCSADCANVGLMWSIETNEEIKQRLEKEYFKPIIFD